MRILRSAIGLVGLAAATGVLWPSAAAALQPGVSAPLLNPDDALTKLRFGYAERPFAERVLVRVIGAQGAERGSVVQVWADGGFGTPERPKRVRLELGRLLIYADANRLIAVNKSDPAVYFERAVGESGPLAALRESLPPVPLPQLAWGFWDPATSIAGLEDAAHELAALAGFSSSDLRVNTQEVTVSGSAGGAPVRLVMTAKTGRLRTLTIQPQGADSRARIELVCERLPPPPEGNWAPETTGRRKVEQLSMLRGADAEVAGGPVQGLVLKTADGAIFDHASVLRREPDAPPAALILVVYRTSEPAAEAHAKLAAFTAEGLAADRAAPGETGLPAMRLVVRSVAAPDAPPEEDEARRVSAGWERAGAPPLLWSDSAQAIFGRFGIDAPLMVVVLDDQQRLAGSIPLPNAPEAMQLYADLDTIVEKISPRK